MPIGVLPDYPLWDWAASNGSATAAQTQAAYNAVVNQGFVRDFSRLVWNDIVDLLYGGIVAAGLSWDEKYTTAERAKISNSGDGTLTAAMFNSVTHNLDRIKPGFLWVWDKTRDPGYTGRLPFVTDEKIYGWYFEELILVLNIFIALLRGDEDYVNFLRYAKDIDVPRKGVLLPAQANLLVGHHLAPVPVQSHMDALPVAFAGYAGMIEAAVRGLAEAKALTALNSRKMIPVKDAALLRRYTSARMHGQSSISVVSHGNLQARIYRFFHSRYLIQIAARGLAYIKPPAAVSGRYLTDAVYRGQMGALEAVSAGKGMYLTPIVSRGLAAAHDLDKPHGQYIAPAVYRGL